MINIPSLWDFFRDVGPTGGGGGGSSNQKVQLGMFTVYPALGFILPGGKVEITVDCTAETAGKCEEVRVLGGCGIVVL